MALRLIVDSDDETLYHDEIASANPTYQRYSTNLAGVDNQRRQTLQTSHSLPTNTPVSIASNNAPIAQSSSTKMSLNEQRQRKKHRKQHLLLNSMSKSQSNIQHTPSTRIAYNQANYPGTLSHQNSGKTSTGSSPHQSQHNETKPASSAMAMAQLSPVASHVSHHDFNFNIDTITSKNNTPMKGNFEKMDRDDKDLMIVGGLLQANQDLLANASSMDEYDQEEGIPPKAISSLRKKKRDSLPKASNTSMDVKKKVGVDDDQDAPLVERSMTLDQDESHLWADVNMMSSDSDPDDVKLKMTMRSSTSSPASSHSSSRASSSSASMQAMDDEFDEMPSDDLQPIAPDDSVDQQATAMPPPSTVNKAMPRKASDLTQNDVLLRTGNKQNNEKSQFVDGMGVDNSVMSTSSIMGNDSSYFHHHHQTSFMLFQSPVAYSVESPNMQINDIFWVSTNTNRYLHQVPSSSQGGSARSAESSESQVSEFLDVSFHIFVLFAHIYFPFLFI